MNAVGRRSAAARARSAARAGLAAAALALAACGGGGPATTLASARPSSTATLAILEPTPGQTVASGSVLVRVRLQHARIVPATSQDLRPDEGHLHVMLDGSLITMTAKLETTLPDVAAGEHLLKVEFVANDHAPFNPRVIAATSFEATG